MTSLADLPPPPLCPPPRRPSAGHAAAFHLGGVALSTAAGFVAFVALFFLAFGTSSCDRGQFGGSLTALRVGTACIGVGLAAVPGLWACLACRGGFKWVPWAAFAQFVLAAVCLTVIGTTDVSHSCLFGPY